MNIRVLCPRGHFIADVRLDVDRCDGITMWPTGPHKRSVFDQLAGWYGFWMSRSRANVRRRPDAPRWKCPKCVYSANIDYESLALRLTTAALAGQSEYRLTT